MEYLKLLVQAIGHLAWPVAALLIALSFKNEISSLLKRVKGAKFKGVEIDLENAFQEVKTDALDAGITMRYPLESYQKDNIDALQEAPEWLFVKTWQEIENLLNTAYKEKIDNKGRTPPIVSVITALVDNSVLGSELASLVRKMRDIRNTIIHSPSLEMTRGELIEWLGLSRSITDRLSRELKS